jgi:hypothetical protein
MPEPEAEPQLTEPEPEAVPEPQPTGPRARRTIAMDQAALML